MSPIQALRLSAVAIAMLLGMGSIAAEAELLVYEPFDYAVGANLNGLSATGRNLTGTYSASPLQDLVISGPSLTYGNLRGPLPSVAGNRLNDANGTVAGIVRVSLDQVIPINAGEEVFFSALFTFDDSTGGNRLVRVSFVDDVSGDELSFGETAVGLRGVSVGANTAGTAGSVSKGADNSFSDGQTLWLIGRYVNNAGLGNDSLQLLGYDTTVAQAISPSFDVSDPNAQFAFSLFGLDINFAKISSLRFEVRGDDNNFLDEVRIGSTYAAVTTPEPASVVLLLLTAVGCCLRRRRAA
jgi:hypothetical protein